MLTHEVGWYDADENNSLQVAARLAADATTVKGAIGDRISTLVQNGTLMLTICIIGFTQHWRMALVILSTFPLQVAATFFEVVPFWTPPSPCLESSSIEVGLVTEY